MAAAELCVRQIGMMDPSLALYLAFLPCGIGQIFTFSAPMVVAAVIPFSAVVALFAGWLPVLASALALFCSRVTAWIAIVGAESGSGRSRPAGDGSRGSACLDPVIVRGRY